MQYNKRSLLLLPTSQKMSTLSTLHLHKIFNKLDKNGDGLVSLDELMWLLERIGVGARRDDVELLIGKETLDPVDFLFFYDTLMVRGNNSTPVDDDIVEEERGEGEVRDRDLRNAFRVFDLNDDGFISCEELEIALSRLGLWDERCGWDCKSMISAYDSNSDGLLDFEEFKDMMMMPSSA